MNFTIHEMKPSDYKLLENFLYEAIFVPEGVEPPPGDIIKKPDLQVYIEDFGKRSGDYCLCAESEGKIIGAVWVRLMKDYGYVDDETPSFAISLYKPYRGHGIGTQLMEKMLELLRVNGYKQASLAVQKANYAFRMYKKIGFVTVDENEEEYIMTYKL